MNDAIMIIIMLVIAIGK